MAAMANIVAYDDESTPVIRTYVPVTDVPVPFWRESNASKSKVALERLTQNHVEQKNGVSRRVLKLEVPVMEQATGAAADGYAAPPKVAHTIVVQFAVFAHNRATQAQVANAVKLLHNALIGDVTAGTGNAWKNASDAGRQFVINEVLAN